MRSVPRTILPVFALLLAGCVTASIPKVRLKPGEFGMQVNKNATSIQNIAYSQDGRYIALGRVDAGVVVWDIGEGRKLWTAPPEDDGYRWPGNFTKNTGLAFVGFTLDGKRVVALTYAGTLSVRDVESGKRLHRFKAVKDKEVTYSAVLMPDGASLLTCGVHVDRHTYWALRLWDLQKGTLSREIIGPEEKRTGRSRISLSPDGKSIIAGGAQGVIIQIDLETGRETRTFEYRRGTMYIPFIGRLAYFPDGKRFMSNGGEGPGHDGIRIWDMESGQTIQKLGDALPRKATLSPDGTYVLAGEGYQGVLKLWDVETGKVVRVIKGKQSFLLSLADEGVFSPDGKRLVTFSHDAAIRVWDLATGEEIAMMAAFDDGEWLAVTAEGYYNASLNGHKYLNVLYGDRRYTPESFYDVFYRPDIVGARLMGQDINGLTTITLKDAVRNPPPVVEVKPMAPGTSKVCYQVKSAGGGIGEVRVFHNGKLIESDGFYKEAPKQTLLAKLDSKAIYQGMRDIAVKGEVTSMPAKSKSDLVDACKDIDAVPGVNEVSVAAFNKENTVQSLMKTVSFTSSKPAEEPHLTILSVGIDRYKDESISLKYAVKDAKGMEEKLLQQAATLYKPENIHHSVLTDADATKAGILAKIEELSKKVRAGDSFILFLAGHGVLLGNQYYVVTGDYDGTGGAGLIGSNEIVEMSKKIASLSQLFIFDTCHAGGVDSIVSGLYDARMSVLAKKMGLHVYASASSLQQAMDGYQGNGLFTHSLLDGLDNKKEADQDKDGKVSVAELGAYSKGLTAELSGKLGHAQTPVIMGFGRDSALYRLSP